MYRYLHRGDIVRSFCVNIPTICTVVLAVLGLRCGELLLLYIRIGHGTANLVYILYTHERVCRNTRGHWSKATAAIARSNILLFRQLPVNRIINVKYNTI